jgi:hypothetical protein
MPYPIRSGTGESRVGFGMGESRRQKSAQTRDVGSFQSRRRHVRVQAVRLSAQEGKVVDRPSPFPFSVIPRQPQRPTITNPEAIDFESMRRPRSESQATGLHRWVKGAGTFESIHADAVSLVSQNTELDDRPRPNVIGFAAFILVIFCKRSSDHSSLAVEIVSIWSEPAGRPTSKQPEMTGQWKHKHP